MVSLIRRLEKSRGKIWWVAANNDCAWEPQTIVPCPQYHDALIRQAVSCHLRMYACMHTDGQAQCRHREQREKSLVRELYTSMPCQCFQSRET